MNLFLSSRLSERISKLARRTGYSPLVLIHQAIEEFLERCEREENWVMPAPSGYEPQ